jgi:LmbE family N-acetylglucosaminyl deacetylase
VFAPHPDDETLATGELIQLALQAGAAVRVVFATDGDNNPWPQRWLEKRWRIGANERSRWGARRRAEAASALARLGVARESARFLGWSDLGLTAMLMRDDSAIDVLAAEIATFAPTHVAMPSMRDRHPDHGALRVMIELAIEKTGTSCTCLGYVVHGRSDAHDAQILPRDVPRHERKRAALVEHASQITLSRRRLMRWANAPESFETSDPRADGAMPHAVTIPLERSYRFLRRHDVLVVIATGTHIDRLRVRLPRLVRAGKILLLEKVVHAGRIAIELAGGSLHLKLDESAPGNPCGYVKLERSEPRLVIFDNDTWHRFEAFADAHETPATSCVEPVAVAQRASL